MSLQTVVHATRAVSVGSRGPFKDPPSWRTPPEYLSHSLRAAAGVCVPMQNVSSPGVDCRPANGSPPTGNIRRIFGGIFEMLCAEWFTSVDSRRLSTVELKSKVFLAVDSGAWTVCIEHRGVENLGHRIVLSVRV
eukprot:1194815-Prorocentrum_minimum.AAC.4